MINYNQFLIVSNSTIFKSLYRIRSILLFSNLPRKTFTALLPVTLPIDESAYLSLIAATLDANVSVSGTRKTIRICFFYTITKF